MKTLLKVVIGIVVVFVLALGAVFFFTKDMVETGDNFFLALKEGNIPKAYTYLSDDFKSNTDEAKFEEFVEMNSITHFKDSSWSERSISGGRGVLTGSISTEDGGVIPLRLSFVKGEKGWKIYSIEKPSSGIQDENEALSLPSEAEQIAMVKDAAKQFADAVNKKDCTDFYNGFSSLFKQQFTIEKLNGIYKSFFDSGIDFTVLQNFSPVFDKKPSIDEDGFLSITGYFPTQPNKFYFDQKYVYEGLGWKLSGYSVDVK